MCIYDLSTGNLRRHRSPKAFTEQPIHGIHVHPLSGAILLWGSSAVSYLPGGWNDEKEVSGKAKDWIYAAALSPYEGHDGLGVVVTAHNDMVPVTLNHPSGTLMFGQPISPSRPILYSATLTFLSPSTLLVVGGTVFGEILVWRCHLDVDPLDTSKCSRAEMLYTLTGHEGSIFGVAISPALDTTGRRILASCSDDRTIRLWDITEDKAGEHESTSGDSGAMRETGFSAEPVDTTSPHKPLTTAMGHASRIWGVRIALASDREGSSPSIAIYSFGEDATMQRWAVDHNMSKLTLEQTFSLHDGKHLWAHYLAMQSDGSLLLATGGADSQISVIDEEAPTSDSRDKLVTVDINDIIRGVPAIVGTSKRAKEIITRYDFLSSDELVAMTSSGRILRGRMGARAPDWRIVAIEDEASAQDLGLCYALKRIGPGAVVMGTTSGNVYLYSLERGLSLVTKLPGRIMDLISAQDVPDADGTADVYVQLQGNMSPWYLTFELSTGSLQRKIELADLDDRFVAISALKARGHVFLGSRHGYLSVLKLGNDSQTSAHNVLCTLSPRSPDAISCIVEIPSEASSSPPLYILTTSRDGYYRIYHVQWSPDLTLSLLHETPAPFGPILTGAYFTTPSTSASSNSGNHELILHGFRGKEFLIYNESRRLELASILCGGAHRMHCLWMDPSSTETERLRFAFTRTSLLSMFSQESAPHRVLKTGTHGREIRALSSNDRYLATGGEDTTIRIWSLPTASTSLPQRLEHQEFQPQHLATVKCHNTGLQHLHFLSSSYLLSSGGFEEFFIWRVRRLAGAQYGGVAVVREAKLEGQSISADSDLRIMNFDAYWTGEEEQSEMVVTMVLSDSTMKTYTYTQEGGFVLVAKGQYTGACITQVRHLTSGDVAQTQLVTGSTDGNVCIWVADSSTSRPLNYRLASAMHTHQNTVKALDLIPNGPGFLLLTGGDDNSLCVSHLNITEPTADTTAVSSFYIITKQARVSRAHAASINGVSFILRQQGILGISASNDQRVKLWDLGASGEKLVLLADRYSGVADPGDIELLDHEGGRVMVGGVGMEIWETSHRQS